MKRNWDEIEDIADGIVGRISDTNTSEQNQQLQQKLNDKEWKTEHSRLLDDKYIIDRLKDRIDSQDVVEEHYQQFKAMVDMPEPKTKPEPKPKPMQRNLILWRSIAAVFIVAVCIGAIYLVTNNSSSINKSDGLVANNSLSPVIELPDGSKINVLDAKSSSSLQDYGYTVEDGVVKYVGDADSDAPQKVNKVTVPAGAILQVLLPDSSHVWLNSESSMSFPSKFSADTREITVSGEVYVNVKHNRTIPFIVHNDDNVIKVYGTEFNIRNYSDENSFCVTLVNGKISYQNTKHNEDVRFIEPGYALSYTSLDQIKYEKVNLNETIGWFMGNINYRGRTLEYIINDLSRLYNVNFVFEDDRIKNMKFNADFKRFDSVDTILDILETCSDVKFVSEKSGYSIKIK